VAGQGILGVLRWEKLSFDALILECVDGFGTLDRVEWIHGGRPELWGNTAIVLQAAAGNVGFMAAGQ
jgi:hypothetical protein